MQLFSLFPKIPAWVLYRSCKFIMRTGIKRLSRKVINQLCSLLSFRGIPSDTFPDRPISPLRLEVGICCLQNELRQRNIAHNLGSLYTLPHPAATKVYKRLIDYNPGNLGSWSDDSSKTSTSTKFEYEVIHKLIDLYHGKHNKISGYITSGGTEGNIFALWLGRSYLEQYCKTHEICLLKTSLTHYSIRKAGQLCKVHQVIVPLNKALWNIDGKGFISSVQNLYKEGYRGFLLPLTLGYTSTGTCDDIEVILKEVKKLEKVLKGVKIFIWVDAALNGIIAPFIETHFQPFRSSSVQAYVVDFHKFGLVPYPAGVVLHRKPLKKLIEQPIDYLSETDSTLLGSRSGIPSVSIWAMIHSLGKLGYNSLVEEQIKNKRYFMKQIKSVSATIEIITHPHSLSCGLIFRGLKDNRLPQWFEEKYGLYAAKTKLVFYPHEDREEVIYKFFFLPHMKKRVIIEFIGDLKNV